MSLINDVSRELYINSIKHVYSFTVFPKITYSYPTKIWETLYVLKTYVAEADQKISPPVFLSKNLSTLIKSFETIFFNYLISKKVNLSALGNLSDDSQSTFIFNSLFNNLSNTLDQYLQNDNEFYLTRSKESLDTLFTTLIVGLNDYRSYFNFDIQTSLVNYQNVESILKETSQQKSDFFNEPSVIDKSVAINAVNINNPVAYNTNSDWKSLFLDLKNKTFNFINQNIQAFYIKNTISSSLQSILYSESSNYDSKVNYITNYTFEGSEITDNSGLKIKVNSIINTDISNWNNHSVIYYNSNNAYTKSKIISVDKDSKILKLYPYNGLSSQNKTFTFLTINEGINIEKDFQSFDININNSTLFSLEITSGSNNYKNIDFKISNDSFKNNYISFPIATSNPLNNGWVLNTQISGVNSTSFNQGFLLTDVSGTSPNYSPNNYSSDILFYRDNQNNSFILNKKDFNASGTNLYTYFYINESDKNQKLNVQFDYTILSKDFLASKVEIQICSFQLGKEVVLKTLKTLDNTYNKKNNYSDSFTTNNNNAYKFKIKLLNYVNSFQISFNNFYIGKNTFSQNTITYDNPKKLLQDLYLSNPYFNNYLIISFNQTTNVNSIGEPSTSYKIKLSSEPMFLGSKISYRFHNINSNLNWLLSDEVLTGIDPIKIVDTGREKKYYESFTSLNQKIFNILNSYALTKLLTKNIFNEEEDQFDIGVNVNKNIKSYVNDLLNEFKDSYTIDKDILNDPRSNFLRKGPQDTLTSKPIQWKNGGLRDVFGLKEFTKFKSQLEKIKSSLKKVKSVLEAIKAFIKILEELIELGEDILGALLDQVVSQVEKVVDNIASTGLYWFPIIDYFMVDPTKSNWFKEWSKDLIGYQFLINPYPGEKSITVNNTFLKELKELKEANSILFQKDIEKQANRVGEEGRGKRWENGIPWLPYRSTTYQEFIDLIVSGFLDEGDLPEIGLKVNAEGETELQNGSGMSYSGFKDEKGKFQFPFSPSASIIRPGAPKWTTGSQSIVAVIAICLPAPEDLIAGWEAFLKGLLNILKPIDRAIDYVYAGTFNEKNAGLQKITFSGEERRAEKLKKLTEKQEIILKELKSLNEEYKKIYDDTTKLRNDYNQIKSPTKEQIQNTQNLIINNNNKEQELADKVNKKNEELKKIQSEIEEVKKDTYKNYYFEPKLSNFIKWIEKELSINNDYEPPSNRDEIVKEAEKIIKGSLGSYIGEVIGDSATGENAPQAAVVDWWGQSTMVDEILEERSGRLSGSRGKYPDFLGVSLGSLAPGLYSLAKGFLNKIKKLNKKQSTFNLSDKFQQMINPIEAFIKNIEEIILMIEDIVNAIDAILDISITYLVIKSDAGVNDIINQLQNAEGFPNEDKRQIILGGVLGAGTISPTGDEFNFSSYFKDAAEEFKEDKKDMFQDLKNSNQEKGIDFLNKFFN